MQQLLLRAAQVVVGLTGLLVQHSAVDSAGNLATHGDQQVHVGGRELPESAAADDQPADDAILGPQDYDERSEEHTSELQSPCNLVCRLLLEKKKKYKSTRT